MRLLAEIVLQFAGITLLGTGRDNLGTKLLEPLWIVRFCVEAHNRSLARNETRHNLRLRGGKIGDSVQQGLPSRLGGGTGSKDTYLSNQRPARRGQ